MSGVFPSVTLSKSITANRFGRQWGKRTGRAGKKVGHKGGAAGARSRVLQRRASGRPPSAGLPGLDVGVKKGVAR